MVTNDCVETCDIGDIGSIWDGKDTWDIGDISWTVERGEKQNSSSSWRVWSGSVVVVDCVSRRVMCSDDASSISGSRSFPEVSMGSLGWRELLSFFFFFRKNRMTITGVKQMFVKIKKNKS